MCKRARRQAARCRRPGREKGHTDQSEVNVLSQDTRACSAQYPRPSNDDPVNPKKKGLHSRRTNKKSERDLANLIGWVDAS